MDPPLCLQDDGIRKKAGDENEKQRMRYSPNASRNRLVETCTDTVGWRTIPSRNASQIGASAIG